MAKHAFGGDWTTDKLERVRRYLVEYTKIFKSNPRARYFTTTYVDAFAGTGERVDSSAARRATGFRTGFALGRDAESLQKGSARIALEVEPCFDRFLFIERSAKHVRQLEKLREEFRSRAEAIRIEQGDANDVLQRWCGTTNWRRNRAVVFLDPYGMQVDWVTIEAVAATQAIDLWLLFPFGVAVNRLLTRNGPPPKAWADALTRIFGTDEWREAFYKKKRERTLLGDLEIERREADFEAIGEFFIRRLNTVFAQVAPDPLVLTNSRGRPIYLLCFAAGNPKGAPTAVRIAQHILKI
ncbi:MAG: three-Cys-motif partner protein TcmP [Planctomycetales bacterium]